VRWRRRIIAIALGLVFTAFAVELIAGKFDWDRIQDGLERMNPLLLFVLMATLPLGGFSVAVVYLVAGARFGPWLGGAVVAGATAVHLAGSHWIGRSFLRQPVERILAKHRHRLPSVAANAGAEIAAIMTLVPGLPYFVRNYLLALGGIRFRTYFAVCLPLYVAHSYLTIFLGDMAGEWSTERALILGGVFVAKLAICGLLLRHLQHRFDLKSALQRTPLGDKEKAPEIISGARE
jgi:uncharacterized membrane protein YdjX (TVP38/TMEM64 family)